MNSYKKKLVQKFNQGSLLPNNPISSKLSEEAWIAIPLLLKKYALISVAMPLFWKLDAASGYFLLL